MLPRFCDSKCGGKGREIRSFMRNLHAYEIWTQRADIHATPWKTNRMIYPLPLYSFIHSFIHSGNIYCMPLCPKHCPRQ